MRWRWRLARVSANDSVKPKGPGRRRHQARTHQHRRRGYSTTRNAFSYLTELSDDVGGRVTGSPAGQKAIDWGVAKMKIIGLANVHTEKWSMWKGWTRGTASAEMLAPLHRTLTVDAMGWTGSTPTGGAEAEVVTANLFDMDAEITNISRFRGKIVLMKPEGVPKKSFWMLFAQYGDFLKQLHKAGAVAVIGGQGGFKAEGMHLTHTGILGFAEDFAIPVVDMAMEDERSTGTLPRCGKNCAPPHQRAKHFYRRSGGVRECCRRYCGHRASRRNRGRRRASRFLGFK